MAHLREQRIESRKEGGKKKKKGKKERKMMLPLLSSSFLHLPHRLSIPAKKSHPQKKIYIFYIEVLALNSGAYGAWSSIGACRVLLLDSLWQKAAEAAYYGWVNVSSLPG